MQVKTGQTKIPSYSAYGEFQGPCHGTRVHVFFAETLMLESWILIFLYKLEIQDARAGVIE